MRMTSAEWREVTLWMFEYGAWRADALSTATGSLAAALEQMLPINGAAANKMPSRNSSACASANSLASIAEGSSGEEDGEDADADATDLFRREGWEGSRRDSKGRLAKKSGAKPAGR